MPSTGGFGAIAAFSGKVGAIKQQMEGTVVKVQSAIVTYAKIGRRARRPGST